MVTVEQTLQIGYTCGLETVAEAYGQVMRFYDCFFNMESFSTEHRKYFNEFKKLDLLEEVFGDPNYLYFKDMSIEDAAKKIGIELKELHMPPPPPSILDLETF